MLLPASLSDCCCAKDLAFAVAAAPVVLPPAYGGPIPSFDEMPTPVQAVVNEMRVRAGGGVRPANLRRATKSVSGQDCVTAIS